MASHDDPFPVTTGDRSPHRTDRGASDRPHSGRAPSDGAAPVAVGHATGGGCVHHGCGGARPPPRRGAREAASRPQTGACCGTGETCRPTLPFACAVTRASRRCAFFRWVFSTRRPGFASTPRACPAGRLIFFVAAPGVPCAGVVRDALAVAGRFEFRLGRSQAVVREHELGLTFYQVHEEPPVIAGVRGVERLVRCFSLFLFFMCPSRQEQRSGGSSMVVGRARIDIVVVSEPLQ